MADLAVKRLATKQSSDSVESNRLMIAGFVLALQRFTCSLQMAHDPYKCADPPGDFEQAWHLESVSGPPEQLRLLSDD